MSSDFYPNVRNGKDPKVPAQFYLKDSGEIELEQPQTWDGEPLYSPASVAEGLFDADAFTQMRGQLAMGADDETC